MPARRDIRTLVVEDEPAARDLLTAYIVKCPELKLTGITGDGLEAVRLIDTGQIDLVFLDIDLPGISGFEILARARKDPYVVFTTGSRESALEAFEIGAVDYLLKPIAKDRFTKAVERALLFFQQESTANAQPRRHGLFIAEKENHYQVAYADIIYIASHENYCSIHTSERDYVTYSSLKQMEERLPKGDFLRIYKQYIVNVHQIAKVQSDLAGNYSVFLKDEDETQLPVGRAYVARMKELLR